MLKKSAIERRYPHYHEMIPTMTHRKEKVNRYCPVYKLRLNRILYKLSVWRGTKDFSKERLSIINSRWANLQNLLKSIERRTA